MGNIHSLNKYLWSSCGCQARGNSTVLILALTYLPARGGGVEIDIKEESTQTSS